MKKYLFLIMIVTGCTVNNTAIREKVSLSGEWGFRIDSADIGVDNKWYNEPFTETVRLPGSMTENGKGYEVDVNTNWTGDIIDKTYFTDDKYAPYRVPGNIKIPFWLKPIKYYKGVAWYSREFDIPENFEGKRIEIFLERCHWETTLYVNGKAAGSINSLSTPHEYDITDLVVPGKNKVAARVDNRVVVAVGVNSHSISDHTQSNWNGITGDISLRATSPVYINDIRIYPDIKNRTAKVIVGISNKQGSNFEGRVEMKARGFNSENSSSVPRKVKKITTKSSGVEIVVDYPMGRNVKLWSEFNPSLYKLSVNLEDSKGKLIDSRSADFGMREFKTSGTHFEVNGIPVFLRGTLECCIFPITGYPPSDTASWEKVLQTCKDYGLNHIRFHSWCPPEAAFIAADKLGVYFHIECSSWANQGTSLGNGDPVDKFIYEEGDRILKEYGNHPSFCMLAYGNEPAGKNQGEYLGKLLTYWKSKDNRRVYTSAAGWPVIPENEYNLTSDPRIQHWGEGLKSIINRDPPQTMFDYRDYVAKFSVPTVSHEIGQWCVYPDFREIEKYTGVLKATNFEIFRESLINNKMGDQAEDFLIASGKLQVLCYKSDIEAALRTPGFGGFHLLQLHDFPGQGSALVGVLNPFFGTKGYVTPEEFRMFCNQTVPLARIKKMVYTANEAFSAQIEVAHYGAKPIDKAEIICQVINEKGNIIHKEIFTKDRINISGCNEIGLYEMSLDTLKKAQRLTLEVSILNTDFKNRWDFWVYPAIPDIDKGNVLVTDFLDKKAEAMLNSGGSVLLLNYGKIGKEKGAKVAIGFSSIFWNTAWTGNQAPHTLGILCDPKNPLFSDFPTESHSNWQWWDPVTHSQVMILSGFPADLRPLIQPIDTWFENRRLALAFEARSGKGRLLVCSIDLKNISDERLASKQLLVSILKYMNSNKFDPRIKVSSEQILSLTR
jgi:hypothetical protein